MQSTISALMRSGFAARSGSTKSPQPDIALVGRRRVRSVACGLRAFRSESLLGKHRVEKFTKLTALPLCDKGMRVHQRQEPGAAGRRRGPTTKAPTDGLGLSAAINVTKVNAMGRASTLQ